MLRRQCALLASVPATALCRARCAPRSIAAAASMRHSDVQYSTLSSSSTNSHPISRSKPAVPVARARRLPSTHHTCHTVSIPATTKRRHGTQAEAAPTSAHHSLALPQQSYSIGSTRDTVILEDKRTWTATSVRTNLQTHMSGNGYTESTRAKILPGDHIEAAAAAYATFVAERKLFKDTTGAFKAVRTCNLDIADVLKVSIKSLANVRAMERNSPSSDPRETERLRLQLKNRVILLRWLYLERGESDHDTWLFEGLCHWYREIQLYLRVTKTALDEATYAVCVSKFATDLKTANAALAAMETLVVMKRLASVKLSATELFKDMQDPANSNGRVHRDVRHSSKRQIEYGKLVDVCEDIFTTMHALRLTVPNISSKLRDLSLLERGLFGLLHARNITFSFRKYVAAAERRTIATAWDKAISTSATSAPCLLEIERGYKQLVRALHEDTLPLIRDFELQLLKRVKDLEASDALLPYAAQIRRHTISRIKLNNLRFQQDDVRMLGPHGYRPSKRFKALCLRAAFGGRHQARLVRSEARYNRMLSAGVDLSSEDRASRRQYSRTKRDSVFRKVLGAQQELIVTRYVSRLVENKTVSKKRTRALRGMVRKKMVLSRRVLRVRKILSFRQNVVIRKYFWNLGNILRYKHVQPRPELRLARKQSARRRWRDVIGRIWSDSNRLGPGEQWTLAGIVRRIPERTFHPSRIRVVVNTQIFSLTRQRKRRQMRALLRQFPPIIHINRDSPTLSLPSSDSTLGKVCGILGFEGLPPVQGDVKDNDVSGRDEIIHNRPKGGSIRGRTRLNPTPRMQAPQPGVCFAETRTIHCASDASECPVGAEKDATNSSYDSANHNNNTNSTKYDENDNNTGKEMPDNEQSLPSSNIDMSQESGYPGDSEHESDLSNGSDFESEADQSDAESEMDIESEIHIPLSYQIPPDTLRAAMQASPNSQAGYYSHRFYRGPEDEKLSVHYCRSMEVAERVARYFMNEEVLGFDIEWKPWTSPNSIKDNASLIQIASEDRIALFHISLFEGDTPDELMPPTLRTILMDPNIRKVGVAIKGDFTRLETHLKVKAQGVFEVSRLHNLVEYYTTDPSKVNNRLVSLARQTKQHLQLPLFKGDVRESDWSKRLNADQLRYAATDAYAGLRIFDVLESKRKMMKPTPPTPDNCDGDNKRIKRVKPIPKPAQAAAEEPEEGEDAEEYETAPEDLIDSQQLEAASDTESSSETSASGGDSDADYALQPHCIELVAPHNGESSDPPARTRRVGRVDFSKLTGADPGYPKLPRLPFDNQDDSDSSDAFDPPPKTRLSRRTTRAAPTEGPTARPNESVENDEFEDPELEGLLSSLDLDDVPNVSGESPAPKTRHTMDEPPPVSQGPILARNEDGDWNAVSPPTSPVQSVKETKRRASKATDLSPSASVPSVPSSTQDDTPSLQLKPLTPDTSSKSPEYLLAESWAQAYLLHTIPSPSTSSSTTSVPSRIRATVPHLRAYHLWHNQQLPLEQIAGHLRDPPLAMSTVFSYIAQAVDLERLEYADEKMREVLQGLPLGLRRGRYGRLVERVGGLGGGWGASAW